MVHTPSPSKRSQNSVSPSFQSGKNENAVPTNLITYKGPFLP